MNDETLEAVVDTDGRWVSASPALLRLVGMPDAVEPTGSLWDVVHPVSEALVRRVVSGESAMRDGFRCRLVLPDRSSAWTHVRHARTTEREDDAVVERVRLTFTPPVAVRNVSSSGPDSEHHFRAFFENSFDAAMVTAPDGSILEANPAACAMLGFTIEELRAAGRTAVLDTSDPRLAALLRDRAATGLARGRLTMRRKDGSRFEADLASSVYYDERGASRTSMVIRDLTDLIEGEQAARRESLELARRIEALTVQSSYASSPSGIYRALLDFAMAVSPAEAILIAERTSENGELVDVYAGWNMGAAAQEEAPPSVQSSVHSPATIEAVVAQGRSAVIDDVRAAARPGVPAVSGPPEVQKRSRSAVLVPIAAHGAVGGVAEFRSSRPGAFDQRHVAPIRLAATVAGVAVNDLRHHEQERRARRRAEAAWRHLQEVVDRAPVMMATTEGPEHVFSSANRRYLETLDRPHVIGKRVIDVYPETVGQGLIEILDRVYRTGDPFVAEAMPTDRYVAGDLTRFYVNLTYQPIRDGDGVVTGLLANMNDVTDFVRANERLSALNIELREAYDQTIRSWGRALDVWDRDTAGHSQRVTDLTVQLAQRLGIHGDDLQYVRWGAQLHDIGKMAIPETILKKPGKLSDDEWAVMKTHTTHGARFLEPISYLRRAIDIPLWHHERWDGSGYPDGLAGEDIPLAARVFAIVDVYDALTSDRPYRRAWKHDQAIDHIREQTGSHFDPRVVHAFLAMAGETHPLQR